VLPTLASLPYCASGPDRALIGQITGYSGGMPDRPAGASVDVGAGEQAGEPRPAAQPASRTESLIALALRLAASRPVRWGFVAVTVGIGCYAIAVNWPGVHAGLIKIGFGSAALALVSVLVALLALMQQYRVLLGALGSRLPVRVAAQILFVGQLGKYLPGSVWPVLAQMELGAAHEVPRRRSASASVLTMLLSLLAGILIGLVMLPFSKGAGPYWWVFLFAPPILLLLYPKVLNRVLGWLLRLARRPALEQPLTGRAIATALAWGVVSWVFFGLQIWLMGERLGLTGASGALLAIGAFSFAWCAGFLVVFVPAGAGVREIVLIALLSPAIGADKAGAVALVSRVLMTLGDLVTAGTAASFARRSRAGAAAGNPGG
jgi:glycosyltransferase 2 family protein